MIHAGLSVGRGGETGEVTAAWEGEETVWGGGTGRWECSERGEESGSSYCESQQTVTG